MTVLNKCEESIWVGSRFGVWRRSGRGNLLLSSWGRLRRRSLLLRLWDSGLWWLGLGGIASLMILLLIRRRVLFFGGCRLSRRTRLGRMVGAAFGRMIIIRGRIRRRILMRWWLMLVR